MHSIETINRIIALLFAICYFYQYIYVLVPYFKKYRIVPKNSGNAGKATIADADLNRKQNRFAAVICARNEEKTLENCIRTLLAQDYRAEFAFLLRRITARTKPPKLHDMREQSFTNETI